MRSFSFATLVRRSGLVNAFIALIAALIAVAPKVAFATPYGNPVGARGVPPAVAKATFHAMTFAMTS